MVGVKAQSADKVGPALAVKQGTWPLMDMRKATSIELRRCGGHTKYSASRSRPTGTMNSNTPFALSSRISALSNTRELLQSSDTAAVAAAAASFRRTYIVEYHIGDGKFCDI